MSERMGPASAPTNGALRDAARILGTVVDAIPRSSWAAELLASPVPPGSLEAALPNLEAFAGLTGRSIRTRCGWTARRWAAQAGRGSLRRAPPGSPGPEVLAEGRMVLAATGPIRATWPGRVPRWSRRAWGGP